jgi:hypothetical protein
MIRVFVGGTGRSGTTILSRWLGSHAPLARFPVESRFIVDAGGILNLYNAVTTDYSTDQARVAYKNFIQMMEKDLTNAYRSPYQGTNLAEIFGSTYWRRLREVHKALWLGTFEGRDFHTYRSTPAWIHSVWVRGANFLRRLTRDRSRLAKKLLYPTEQIQLIRHLDHPEALSVFQNYVTGLFDDWAQSQQAGGWCEDTPANACHIGFLVRLIPDARHACVVRNPWGTTLSYTQQVWAPSDFSTSVGLLTSLYRKIIRQIEGLSVAERKKLKVIRLEDLSKNTIQSEVLDFVGLERENIDGSVEIRYVDFKEERQKLTSEQRDEVESKLGFAIEYFGYQV